MLTVIMTGRVVRQCGATLHTRAYWARYVRENSSRGAQLWETAARKSVRLV